MSVEADSGLLQVRLDDLHHHVEILLALFLGRLLGTGTIITMAISKITIMTMIVLSRWQN